MPGRSAVNTKQKVLMLLEHDRDSADADIKKWAATVNQYDADIILNADADLPVNLRTISSRNLAKEELAKARELKRLYTVALAAVRKA